MIALKSRTTHFLLTKVVSENQFTPDIFLKTKLAKAQCTSALEWTKPRRPHRHWASVLPGDSFCFIESVPQNLKQTKNSYIAEYKKM